MANKPDEKLFNGGVCCLLLASITANTSWPGRWWIAIPLMVCAATCAVIYMKQTLALRSSQQNEHAPKDEQR